MNNKYLSCILALAMWLPTNLLSQAIDQERGAPFITHYPVKEYNGLQQNWAIVQDSKGLMYFGNQGSGVLQFDGVSWRQIPVPNGLVRSLAIDENDRILVGGQNELGYLAPDSTGLLEYISLLGLLDESQRELQQVMNIHPTGTGIFFQARNRLLLVRGDKVQNWEPETVFNRSFLIDGRLYVLQLNIGLMILEDGELKLAPGGDQLADEKIFSMLALDEDRLMVGTLDGLFLYDGKNVSSFHSSADELLVNILHGVMLPDSTIAYATLESGIVIIERTGEVRRIIDRSSGLNNDSVLYLFTDKTAAMWATLNSGIARIDYPGSFSFYADEEAPMVNAYSAARHRGNLYAGTVQGLFRLKRQTLVKGGKQTRLHYTAFEQVAQVKSECFSLLSNGSHLLVGTAQGIFAFDGQNMHLIIDYEQTPFALHRSRRDSLRIFVGHDDGLASFRESAAHSGVWRGEGKIPDVKGYATTLLEDKDGKLWVGSYYSGIRRVDFSPGSTDSSAVQSFDEKAGLPAGENLGWINVFPVGGQPLFATMVGLYRFDNKTGRFRPEASFGKQLNDGNTKIWACSEDMRGNVYFNVAGKRGDILAMAKRRPDGTHQYTEVPFRALTQQSSGLIYPDADGSVWLGTDEAFLNYDPALEQDSTTGFSTLIRRVLTREDSVVFGGEYQNTREKPANKPAPKFAYRDNSLRFEFAATSYGNAASNKYQVFLHGTDDNWSRWTDETHKDYTHLPPGEFIFQVRGQNVYGEISDEANYAFTILPPWYQTWTAYLVWLVLFSSGIIALVKIQVIRAQRIERAKSEQREQIRREMAADFHDGAGDKLAQISLFSKFVQSKMKDGSEETQNALKWTVEAADALKLETRDFIWALGTEHDSLWDVADRIVSHGKDLFRRAQPPVAVQAHGLNAGLKAITLSIDWKRNLIFIFKEGLNNAFKYSTGKQVEIHFQVEGNTIHIRLADNGPGFSPDSEFVTKGIKNMHRRAKKMGADLAIDSQPGGGTTIYFKGRVTR